MVCEKVIGKLKDVDIAGKTVEYVDIEWHEAFKKIHRKVTGQGCEVGIRMDDSILTRGLFQDDVIYDGRRCGDRGQHTAVRSDRSIACTGTRKICCKGLLRDRQPPCTAFLGR